MDRFYEKQQWLNEAQSYGADASRFSRLATFVGFMGIVLAFGWIVISIVQIADGDGGWRGIFYASVLTFHSMLLIMFGAVMRGLSKVVGAVFEMSVTENRVYLADQATKPED